MAAPQRDPKKVVTLQGRDYSTWANTLDTAHALNTSPLVRFLGIKTAMVQMPAEDNGFTCIIHACAAFVNADGDRVEFEGYGDANPGNTKPQVAAHFIRFAETRAKGRALRDAVNIGEVLEEELGGEEENTPVRPAPPPRAPAPRPLPPAPAAPAPSADLEAMRTVLVGLCEADEPGRDAIRQKEPGGLDAIPDARVAAWVQWMRGRAESGQAGKPVKAKGGAS